MRKMAGGKKRKGGNRNRKEYKDQQMDYFNEQRSGMVAMIPEETQTASDESFTECLDAIKNHENYLNITSNTVDGSPSSEPDIGTVVAVMEDDKRDVRKSIAKLKKRKSRLSCYICNHKFPSRRDLVEHVKTCLNSLGPELSCDVCSKKFYNKTRFERHVSTHKMSSTRNLTNCDICGKTFYDKSTMVRHRKIHFDEKVKCDECGKSFSRPDVLKRHIQTHLLEDQTQKTNTLNNAIEGASDSITTI